MRRLGEGGRIDRQRTLRLGFDGREIPAHPGDTLASALLAAGVTTLGRSFKYHRPRGLLAAGSEEPNALVTVARGGGGVPNCRATMVEAHDGLAAVSQNRWPSLGFDALAINDLASPLLGAGFYYKTFMWPKAFWEKLYEPVIRRAAGLGRLDTAPDPDRSEKAFAFCDLLVIGAGPAGLLAALVAGRSGARVILADESFAFGGRLLAESHEVGGLPGAIWADDVVDELRSLPNVRLMPRTTVVGAYDGGTYGALERVAEHIAEAPEGAPRTTFWRIVARRALLAAGAIERPIAFPGNDRPGVMLAGAVRAFLHRWAVVPHRAAVFCNNDDAWRTAADLAAAGVEVAALIDARPDVQPPAGPWETLTGAEVVGTRGRLGLRAITVRSAEATRTIAVDVLGVSGGWSPALHLTSHLGARPVWVGEIAAFAPAQDAVPGLRPVGAAAGDFSTQAALWGGARAAVDALVDLGFTVPPTAVPAAEDAAGAITPVWRVGGAGQAFVDLQNDVTVKDIALAAQEGFTAAEHMKRYTTLGMATDQGKTSGTLGVAILAEMTGRSVAETGVTSFRPPYTPVPIAALGAGGAGRGLAPERLPPAHAEAVAAGAPMLEAGHWLRPGWYPEAGDSGWRDACDREVARVRTAVGVCDVTTLGKIDVQGPDAAAFLDRVYVNTMSTLAVGRVRYGVMLREDGFVLDDGTVARLGPGHFLVSTTTGAAGAVMSHLEFCAECLWPELDVRLVSVTEQWAQIAVAGPRARDLLGGVLAGTIDVPFLGWAPVRVGPVGGRLFRISFSGELGYELAVPAGYGAELWRLLVHRAGGLGGGPYGLEALNVLRIEKGLLTHAELHGRTTLDDLGLGRMLAAKDCIGKVSAARPALVAADRQQLVGLRALGPQDALLGGAHLLPPTAAATVQNDQGYVTSACFSPTLGHAVALGFLAGGRARHGEQLRAWCGLRRSDVLCEVVPPVFHDPEGARARA